MMTNTLLQSVRPSLPLASFGSLRPALFVLGSGRSLLSDTLRSFRSIHPALFVPFRSPGSVLSAPFRRLYSPMLFVAHLCPHDRHLRHVIRRSVGDQHARHVPAPLPDRRLGGHVVGRHADLQHPGGRPGAAREHGREAGVVAGRPVRVEVLERVAGGGALPHDGEEGGQREAVVGLAGRRRRAGGRVDGPLQQVGDVPALVDWRDALHDRREAGGERLTQARAVLRHARADVELHRRLLRVVVVVVVVVVVGDHDHHVADAVVVRRAYEALQEGELVMVWDPRRHEGDGAPAWRRREQVEAQRGGRRGTREHRHVARAARVAVAVQPARGVAGPARGARVRRQAVSRQPVAHQQVRVGDGDARLGQVIEVGVGDDPGRVRLMQHTARVLAGEVRAPRARVADEGDGGAVGERRRQRVARAARQGAVVDVDVDVEDRVVALVREAAVARHFDAHREPRPGGVVAGRAGEQREQAARTEQGGRGGAGRRQAAEQAADVVDGRVERERRVDQLGPQEVVQRPGLVGARPPLVTARHVVVVRHRRRRASSHPRVLVLVVRRRADARAPHAGRNEHAVVHVRRVRLRAHRLDDASQHAIAEVGVDDARARIVVQWLRQHVADDVGTAELAVGRHGARLVGDVGDVVAAPDVHLVEHRVVERRALLVPAGSVLQ